MQLLAILLLLYLVVVLLVLPIWVLVRFSQTKDELNQLRAQVGALNAQLRELRSSPPASAAVPPVSLVPPPTPAITAAPPPVEVVPVLASAAPLPRVTVETAPAAGPVVATSTAEPIAPPLLPKPELPVPPSLPSRPYVPPPPAPSWFQRINWEQFMGAKLFAWLGGLALFLGVGFFVRYSFEQGWIGAELRAAMGFVLGAGLVGGGVLMSGERYRITGQTLMATGVVSLYAVTFACRAIYQFEFFGVLPTFLLMALITAAAFVLAVRLNAQVVAILGILGGFLTPRLLSTGVDNAVGLFGYIALLDLGLAAVALHRRWFYLVALGAAGTIVMEIGWATAFYEPEKTATAMTVCVGFVALFAAVLAAARRWNRVSPVLGPSALALAAAGLGFGVDFVNYDEVNAQPARLFGFLLLIDLGVLAIAWIEARLARWQAAAGGVIFVLLAVWTHSAVTTGNLPVLLVAVLLFAGLHTAFPLLLARRQPEAVATWISPLFPPLALALMLIPVIRLDDVPLLLWPVVMLVDVLAIGLALATATLTVVAVVLVLTLAVTGVWIFHLPATSMVGPSLLLVVGGFAVFFFAACLWIARRLGGAGSGDRTHGVFGDERSQLPAGATLLPFVLLIMASARLSLPNPAPVFGLALLLVILALGLTRLLLLEWLPACALAGLAAAELSWHGRHFTPDGPGYPLAWYLGFYALFSVYPFVFRAALARLTGPWAVAALAGVPQFYLVHQFVKRAMPNDVMGLLPLLFALPPLASLAAVQKLAAADNPRRLDQLAWFGGAGLLFITLIFPVQFDRQWLTVSWALEGAALWWLFHRVPHPGLRLAGTALLITAFVRLALNPAVLSYHQRGETAVFNWYLYAYGLSIAALTVAARLARPPRDQVLGTSAPALFHTLAVILAFLLLNVEIADYFTPVGSRGLTLEFSGSFARDMSYTIGWALFALGLLGGGIWKQARAARYAAIALLSVALLKLFFHDLARLQALYRIGALFAVAVIAILASLAYQRFLPTPAPRPPGSHPEGSP